MNGNLTSDGAVTYAYDVENRIISASGTKTANLRVACPEPVEGIRWAVSALATILGMVTSPRYDGMQDRPPVPRASFMTPDRGPGRALMRWWLHMMRAAGGLNR